MQERRLDGGRRGGYFAAFSRIFLTFLQQSFKIIKLCENRKTSRFSGREGIDEEKECKELFDPLGVHPRVGRLGRRHGERLGLSE